MIIYLTLFLTFLKIGAVAFGGGYAMISLVKEEVLQNAWLTESEFINFIAVAESTPGPIAVNMATFIGSSQAGFLGSVCATLGVVLPSFVIILIIASIFNNLLKFAGVKWALSGIKPVIAALITSTAISLLLTCFLGSDKFNGTFSFDYKSVIIFGVVVITSIGYKKLRKKNLSPILLIIISAILGIILF